MYRLTILIRTASARCFLRPQSWYLLPGEACTLVMYNGHFYLLMVAEFEHLLVAELEHLLLNLSIYWRPNLSIYLLSMLEYLLTAKL